MHWYILIFLIHSHYTLTSNPQYITYFVCLAYNSSVVLMSEE